MGTLNVGCARVLGRCVLKNSGGSVVRPAAGFQVKGGGEESRRPWAWQNVGRQRIHTKGKRVLTDFIFLPVDFKNFKMKVEGNQIFFCISASSRRPYPDSL